MSGAFGLAGFDGRNECSTNSACARTTSADSSIPVLANTRAVNSVDNRSSFDRVTMTFRILR